MAVNIQGIFDGLLEAFALPSAPTLQQFVTSIEQRGIASQDEANAYVTHFLRGAVSLTMLDQGATFDDLMTRARAVELENAVRAARRVHAEVMEFVDYKIEQLQVEHGAVQATLTTAQRVLDNAVVARAWIEANAPGSAQTKADTLLVMDAGVNVQTGFRDIAQRRLDELQIQIERLGGTV
jgi:hypothetical protein